MLILVVRTLSGSRLCTLLRLCISLEYCESVAVITTEEGAGSPSMGLQPPVLASPSHARTTVLDDSEYECDVDNFPEED